MTYNFVLVSTTSTGTRTTERFLNYRLARETFRAYHDGTTYQTIELYNKYGDLELSFDRAWEEEFGFKL